MYFNEVNAFIVDARESGGRVLVHCRAGISRSSSLVAAYLLYTAAVQLKAEADGQLRQIMTHIVTERPIVCPNSSFCQQLIEYEMSLFGSNSVADKEAFLLLIHEQSKLYSGGDHTSEMEFERIPIQVLHFCAY